MRCNDGKNCRGKNVFFQHFWYPFILSFTFQQLFQITNLDVVFSEKGAKNKPVGNFAILDVPRIADEGKHQGKAQSTRGYYDSWMVGQKLEPEYHICAVQDFVEKVQMHHQCTHPSFDERSDPLFSEIHAPFFGKWRKTLGKREAKNVPTVPQFTKRISFPFIEWEKKINGERARLESATILRRVKKKRKVSPLKKRKVSPPIVVVRVDGDDDEDEAMPASRRVKKKTPKGPKPSKMEVDDDDDETETEEDDEKEMEISPLEDMSLDESGDEFEMMEVPQGLPQSVENKITDFCCVAAICRKHNFENCRTCHAKGDLKKFRFERRCKGDARVYVRGPVQGLVWRLLADSPKLYESWSDGRNVNARWGESYF